MVNGIKSGGKIQEGEGCDRPISEKNIILNIKGGNFSKVMFLII